MQIAMPSRQHPRPFPQCYIRSYLYHDRNTLCLHVSRNKTLGSLTLPAFLKHWLNWLSLDLAFKFMYPELVEALLSCLRLLGMLLALPRKSLVGITFKNDNITIEPLKVKRVKLSKKARQDVEKALRLS